MRLKRLVCHGFKSFADRTEFEFDSLLTGIIGPNGCGKSNVVDAIKWVLGDQRARSLRGTEMTDVIFKGAEGRASLAKAEVEITFQCDDDSGRTELRIGRRLTRDKESEYLVNGESVRLKDVRDLLMDTGLGVGAYMVMEQGRIDAVLSANPDSRRAIFEEAAGISRFKMQKRESLRKLERTEQNLARVQDLLEERSKRIRSLKIHAGRARRYREIQGRLRDLKSALAVLEGRDLCTQQDARQLELKTLAEQIAAAEETHQLVTAELGEMERTIAEEGQALEELANRIHQVQSRLDASRSRAETHETRAGELAADALASGQRSKNLAEQKEERRQTLAEVRNKQAEREAELADLHRELAVRNRSALAAQQLVVDLQRAREALRDQVLELIHQRTREGNLAHDQEAQIRVLDGRRRRLEERHAAVTKNRGEVDEERGQLQHLLADLESRGRDLDQQETTALDQLQDADREAATLAQREGDLRGILSEVSGKQQALEEMEAHMEGLDQGPRHLLERSPAGLGRLLDRLEVDLEYSAALEVALGPLVQALVVETRAQGDEVLATVERDQLGRVILLVEAELVDQELARPQNAGNPQDQGDLMLPDGATPLQAQVRWVEGNRSILDWLLRRVYLVAELPDTAVEGICFVTRAGALLRGPRLEGGAGEGQAGLVVRRAQIHALAGEAEDLRRRLEKLLEGKDRNAERIARQKAELRRVGETLRALRAKEQETKGHLGRLEGRGVDLERETQELELEQREVSQARSAAQATLSTHLMNSLLIHQREQSETARETELNSQLTTAQDRSQEASRTETELRLRQVSCAADLEAHKENIRMQDEALAELDRAIAELDARGSEIRHAAQKSREEATRCRAEVSRCTEDLGTLQGERQNQSDALAEHRAQRWQMQETARQWEDRRTTLTEKSTSSKLALADLDHAFARLEEKLREDTEVELRRCLGLVRGLGIEDLDLQGPPAPETECLQGPPLPPAMLQPERELKRLWEDPDFSVPEARKVAQVLQAKRDRLGAVNLGAVEELEEEEDRFRFLEVETEDLKAARRSLMETLQRLEEESRILFETTFEKARTNFQRIFRKLFQGGRADMTLQDPNDSLEAGIDIVARPPGKQLQSINLLSGGERSLTALAILFAVFEVKPSPICILDEVDAALDDTNVERFLRVLRDFIGRTQFCIVTHHKRTMAECQVLYGITMQKRGVSSRIAVDMSQVDKMTNGNQATPEPDASPVPSSGTAANEPPI